MDSRTLRPIAASILVGGYFYLTWDIWPPIITAFLLAALLHPVVTKLQARWKPCCDGTGSTEAR